MSLLNFYFFDIFFLLIFALIYTSKTRRHAFEEHHHFLPSRQKFETILRGRRNFSNATQNRVYTYSRRGCSLRKFNEDIKL